MDPQYRERAPKLVKDKNGKERLLLEEQILGSRAGFGGIGGVGARQGAVAADAMDYKDGRKGGFDPHARIPDMDLDGIDAAFLYPSLGLFAGARQRSGFRRRDVPGLQPLARRLLQALSRPPVRHRHAADAVDRGGDPGDALRPQGARLPRRLPPAQSLQRPQAALAGLRAVLERGGGARLLHRHPRGRQQRHADGRRRPLRRPRRAAHHLAYHGDDAGRDEHDLGRRVRAPSQAARRLSWNRAAAGSRPGSTAWTGTSTTRASTIPA